MNYPESINNKSTKSINKPFEFDSPVEFVLVGPMGKKRAVIAKSKGAQMDLVAYAQRDRSDEDDRMTYPTSFPFPYRLQLRPLNVDSPPTNFQSNHAYDERASALTLVWRGARPDTSQAKRIEKEFHMRIGDMVDALEQHSPGQMEWALSPIIDLCHRAIINSKRNRFGLVYAFGLVMMVYATGIAVFLMNRLLIIFKD